MNLYTHTIFSTHALQRLFKRKITRQEVEAVIAKHEIIEYHPSDIPLPTVLILGQPNGRPLHVVLAINDRFQSNEVVTVYEPGPALWENDFKTRK